MSNGKPASMNMVIPIDADELFVCADKSGSSIGKEIRIVFRIFLYQDNALRAAAVPLSSSFNEAPL